MENKNWLFFKIQPNESEPSNHGLSMLKELQGKWWRCSGLVWMYNRLFVWLPWMSSSLVSKAANREISLLIIVYFVVLVVNPISVLILSLVIEIANDSSYLSFVAFFNADLERNHLPWHREFENATLQHQVARSCGPLTWLIDRCGYFGYLVEVGKL